MEEKSKKISSKKAFTMAGVMIAIVLIEAVLFTSGRWLKQVIELKGEQKSRMQVVRLAEGGLDNVSKIIKTNKRRFAPPQCWKTITTEDVCDPMTSPMMATVGGGTEKYSLPPDNADFTPALVPLLGSGEFEDSTILARESNSLSIHRKYLGPNETKPVLTSNVLGSVNTYFYRQIEIVAHEYDFDGDGTSEELLTVISSIKWPEHNKVRTYSTSRSFMSGN